MKVKKYTNETRSLSLAQKLQAYKEASLGLTTQQGKTAFAFAAGSLAALTPFVAQAQCRTGGPTATTLNSTFGGAFDINNDGMNDIDFRTSTSAFIARGLNGAKLYSGGLGFKVFASSAVIQNVAGKFKANGLPFKNRTNSSGFLGVLLPSGKVGFIRFTTTGASISITHTKTGASSSTTPGLNQVKAGDCASLTVVLPIELTNFAVKPATQHINLAWSTASEKNNAYFAIERSRNGVDFTAIGQVKGNGTTQAAYDYGFTDNDVTTDGLYYYRLKQVDNDGTFTYSAVLSAQLKDATKVKVYPTAVRHNVVNIETSDANQATTVVDMTGRVLKQFKTTPNQIDVSDLGAGVYIVRVGSQVTRIVKSN